MSTNKASSYHKLPSDTALQTTPTKLDANAANIPSYGEPADYSGPQTQIDEEPVKMISSPYRKEHDINFVESQESPTQDQSHQQQNTPDSSAAQYVSPAKNEDTNMDENDLKAMEEIDNLL